MSHDTCAPGEIELVERLFGRLSWTASPAAEPGGEGGVSMAVGIIADAEHCRPGEVAATEEVLDTLGKLSDSGQCVMIGGRPSYLHAWRYQPGAQGHMVGDVDFREFGRSD